MSISTSPLQRTLIVATMALLVAGVGATVLPAVDARVHGFYAQAFARAGRSQAVVLVAVDDATRAGWGDPPWAAALTDELSAEIERGGPRLVIWPQEQVMTDGANEPAMGVDPILGPTLVRAGDKSFPAAALAAMGAAPRQEPLPVRYTTQLPTVSAQRVLAGGIPASSFRDRVVVIGRTDADAKTMHTPLGAMSPAQVEAQALLGVLDGARWLGVPLWLRLSLLALWAVGMAQMLRDRALGEAIGLAVMAGFAVVMFDAALFAAGVMRLGAAAAVLVVGVALVAHLGMGAGRSLVPRRSVAPMRVPLTTTAVDFHKVSET